MNFFYNKVAGAVLGTALVVFGINTLSHMIYSSEVPTGEEGHAKPGYMIAELPKRHQLVVKAKLPQSSNQSERASPRLTLPRARQAPRLVQLAMTLPRAAPTRLAPDFMTWLNARSQAMKALPIPKA